MRAEQSRITSGAAPVEVEVEAGFALASACVSESVVVAQGVGNIAERTQGPALGGPGSGAVRSGGHCLEGPAACPAESLRILPSSYPALRALLHDGFEFLSMRSARLRGAAAPGLCEQLQALLPLIPALRDAVAVSRGEQAAREWMSRLQAVVAV